MLSIPVLLTVLKFSDVIIWSGAGALPNDTFSAGETAVKDGCIIKAQLSIYSPILPLKDS